MGFQDDGEKMELCTKLSQMGMKKLEDVGSDGCEAWALGGTVTELLKLPEDQGLTRGGFKRAN